MRRNRRKPAVSLVGQDLAREHPRTRRPMRNFPALLFGVVLAGLMLAVLRIDIVRLGYALGEALSTQQSLEREFRALTAEVRTLRDPARLAELAKPRGLQRPERVIEVSRVAPPERP